jgi:crossover junction endodeoxyribonuclease RuvC
MSVIGVDLGNCGAVAELTEAGELIGVFDMPTLRDGPNLRPTVSAPLLVSIIAKTGASRAFVEFVGPRPSDGAVQAFAFGQCKGVVLGVLAAQGVPVAFLTPPAWKRAVGLPPGKEGAKDRSRSEAIRRWPGKAALFARAKDDGRAEAALIAVAGLRREGERAHGHLPAGQAAPRAIGAS